MTMDWNKAIEIATEWLIEECDPHGAIERDYYVKRAAGLVHNIRMAETPEREVG